MSRRLWEPAAGIFFFDLRRGRMIVEARNVVNKNARKLANVFLLNKES